MRLLLIPLLALSLFGPASALPAGGLGRFVPDPKLPADQGVPYVIITNDALTPAFQRLVDWKRATGLPAQIISVDWLAKNPHYAGVDLAERIYLLLRDLRLNWRTRWVLLAGDIEVVPPQKIRAWQGQHGGNQVPCDVYYSDILPKDLTDGDAVEHYGWNANGDRFIGDVGKDEFDLVPDLAVGRIPVSTPKEAESYLEKYFEYVTAPGKDLAWASRAVVVGANEFRSNQTKVHELFKELGGAGYTTDLHVEQKPDAITEALNKGQAFFDFLCHGCPSHFWVLDDHTSWGVTQLRTLTNAGKYPIVFANSCNTADFEKPACLAVEFLTKPKAGAVAYLGYSHVSFQSPVNQAMYKLLFGGRCPQLGRAMIEAKAEHAQDKWVGEILNLFGDPEMWVRTGAPAIPKVTEEKLALNQPGRVRVTDAAGKPIAARVTIDAPGVYLAAETDETGLAKLPPPGKAGSARLCVLTQNGGRVEKKVTIDAKPAGLAIGRPTLTVDDDAGNKQKDLNPGETVKFVFTFPKDATWTKGGQWSLAFPENPFLKAEDAAPAEDGTVTFAVTASAKSPPWTQGWMKLSYTAEGDTWDWTFRQPVEGPSISCVSCTVDDSDGNKDRRVGWEDAGRKIRFSVGLLNRGTQKGTNLKLTISSEDPAVTLTRPTVAFGTLPLEDAIHPKDKTFEFQLAADFDGHPIAFALAIEDERGSKWGGRIVFTVPPAPPFLVKAEAALKTVTLSWVPGGSPGVVGYHIHRATSEKGPFTRLTEQALRGGTRYPDSGLKPASGFWYAVTSVTADGLESRLSAPVRGHTLSPLPKAPPEKGGDK